MGWDVDGERRKGASDEDGERRKGARDEDGQRHVEWGTDGRERRVWMKGEVSISKSAFPIRRTEEETHAIAQRPSGTTRGWVREEGTRGRHSRRPSGWLGSVGQASWFVDF